MPIPDYQTLMLPVLKVAADGQEHRIADAADQLADEFRLTEDERKHLLPSGSGPTFPNRVHWAKTYLAQAGLIAATRRGHFRITDRGRAALSNGVIRIDNDYLCQFPEFSRFRERSRPSRGSRSVAIEAAVTPAQIETPDELLRATVKQIDAALGKELLDRILLAAPTFFESLIITLLLAMGYGGSREQAGKIIGKSGGGGIDGVIDQDALGLERVYVQAKRYAADNGVSEPEIRAFSGSLGAAKANKGVFVTTSHFTQPALSFAERHPFRIVLIDGERLAGLMIRHNVGVRIDETLYLKKLDEDFFAEECPCRFDRISCWAPPEGRRMRWAERDVRKARRRSISSRLRHPRAGPRAARRGAEAGRDGPALRGRGPSSERLVLRQQPQPTRPRRRDPPAVRRHTRHRDQRPASRARLLQRGWNRQGSARYAAAIVRPSPAATSLSRAA